MRKLVLVAASGLVAGAFVATAVSAQTTAPQTGAAPAAKQDAATQPRKDPRDVDGDHRASWDEYRNAMADNFTRLDVNKDGVLESAELPQQPKPQPGQKLSRAQFDSQLRAGFDRLDTNKDGYLAGAEFPTAKK
ncbi:hypothetical protein IP90_02589 [Luteimonas cucumeris]|uniref:EF-hand domain-containing protein n=1 Tax=Luteimonas cucumeris TaxID=985012 RepID=A0A562L015_9GAMM|nr:hypothetical protein [Luteimonas cucumeris]TWI00967.1 hypothetical protein IP90_02589 [Luteimonas cucumeris]